MKQPVYNRRKTDRPFRLRLPARHLGKFLLDLSLWSVATVLAFVVRFDGAIPQAWLPALGVTLAIGVVAKTAALLWSRLYLQSWRAITLRDLAEIARWVVLVGLLLGTVALLLRPYLVIPRSIPLLDTLFGGLLLAGVRALRRLRYEGRLGARVPAGDRRRVLIIGAGDAGSLIAREMLRHPETGLEPVGFLDDDPIKRGTRVVSLPVLGTLDDVADVADEHLIDEVLIALPSASGAVLRRVLDTLAASPLAGKVKVRTIPAVHELLSGDVTIDRIREVEVDDLLRREPVQLDTSGIARLLYERCVLVTGAGGSIGSELVRQICRFEPSKVVLFGRGENSLYALERELDRSWPQVTYQSVIGDVRDRDRLLQVLERHRPHAVFHAAAHKHVPLMEANPEEAVLNNIIGTRNVAEAVLATGVPYLVNISTDKAVNPTSIMGASKRIGEYLVSALARDAAPNQVLVSVRFGNVLGSRGSVVPLFKEQIRKGGPVTVTHRDMQRYFMTIPEATQLVLQAAQLGSNGEVYILDMGEPIRIYDLARDLIRLSGLEPGVDIDIVFTGVRPGEKLFEELVTAGEAQAATAHDRILVARTEEVERSELFALVASLENAAKRGDGGAIRRILATFIEGSRLEPSESVTER